MSTFVSVCLSNSTHILVYFHSSISLLEYLRTDLVVHLPTAIQEF